MSDPTIKPGYKTTEFWLTILAFGLSALWASGAISEGSSIDKIIGMAAAVLSALGYTVSRGVAKLGSGIPE